MASIAWRRIGAACAVAGLALTVAACSDDDASGSSLAPVATSVAPAPLPPTTATPPRPAPAATQPPATQPPATQAPASQPPATQAPPTRAPGTEPPTTDPAGDCVAPVGTDTFNDGFPNRMSGMVGSDIRTGAHECFERVVIELAGSGDMPGVRVEYVDDPVKLSPSDETVDIAGGATLVISVAAWMPSMEGEGYAGPTDFGPSNVSHIIHVRQIENFEGMTAWAIGLDTQRDFAVDFLDSPARIVVDIAGG